MKRQRGRPRHEPDDRSRGIVETLAGYAIPQAKIAAVVGVDAKTLALHYAVELMRGAATVEAKLVGNLLRLASGTDGTALKAIMFSLQCRFGWSQYAPAPETKLPPIGKKEQADIDAETPNEGSEWSNLVH